MHPLKVSLRSVHRRALSATLGAFVLLAVAAVPVAAYDPDLFEHEPTPSPSPSIDAPRPGLQTRPATPVRRPAPTPERGSRIGYDVSWPQCNDELPETFSFAIIGVNRGRTYSQNGCLDEQLEWAGPDADFYLNTGNPGPDLSAFWPSGRSEPRECDTPTRRGDDTHDCAYLYGWYAAADGYARVLDAFIGLDWAEADTERIPGRATWWLDVETANSWRGDRSLNVAALKGAVDYLESMEVTEVGFYSTPLLWWRVTHGTDTFEDHPAWHAGAGSEAQARDRCDREGFTGGELRMQQWVEDGIDTNYRCP
jgi:hypothetical protein